MGVVVGVGTGVGYARRSPVCLFGKAKSRLYVRNIRVVVSGKNGSNPVT